MRQILYVLSFLFLVGCEKREVEYSSLCSFPPARLLVVIATNTVGWRDMHVPANAKKEGILLKLVGEKKEKIGDLRVYNDNIYIFFYKEELKTIYTGNLETLYVEHNGNTDILKIKGTYEENKCGIATSLKELIFNDTIDLTKIDSTKGFYIIRRDSTSS